MFLSKNFCFIELEKTATASIKDTFLRHIPDGKSIGQHNFIDEVQIKTEPIFIGSIRNPYDWYISRWSFGCSRKYRDSLYKNLLKKRFRPARNKSIEGQHLQKFYYTFNQLLKSKKYWENLYSDSQNPKKFREWIKSLLLYNRSRDLAEQYYFSSLYKKFGYLTFRYLIMFTKPQARNLLFNGSIKDQNDIENFDKKFNYISNYIKFESLDQDMNKILQSSNITLYNRIPMTNSSFRERDINYYYDEETINLVRELDGYIFKKHSYQY